MLNCGFSIFILVFPELAFGWRFEGVSVVEKALPTAAGSQQLRPSSNG